MDNEELESIQFSSEELELFFNLLSQMNENITSLQSVGLDSEPIDSEPIEPEPIEHELTELYQLEQLNLQLSELLNAPDPEPIEHELTELYQLETLNNSMDLLNEHNSNTYYTDIAELNSTMAELSSSFSDYQDYHWSTNQLYQFTNLLIFPLGLIYFIYRLLKGFWSND